MIQEDLEAIGNSHRSANCWPKARFSISDIGIVSDGGFSYRISDIGGDIGDTRAYRAFILDNIYNEILITKS